MRCGVAFGILWTVPQRSIQRRGESGVAVYDRAPQNLLTLALALRDDLETFGEMVRT